MRNELTMLPVRALLGGLVAIAVALAAWVNGSLSRSGAIAAAALASLCVVGGWSWAAVLFMYFIAATAIGRFTGSDTILGLEGVVAKGQARDAAQVVANGGVFALAAALTSVAGLPWLVAGGLGALAASSADTWATDIGVRYGVRPRSLVSRTYVRPGESGGVTEMGFAGSLFGAAAVGAAALAAGFSGGLVFASTVAGVFGSLADSVIGATLQERRWCDHCREPTEKAIHGCGHASRQIGGIQRLDNDVVNLLSTLAGFLFGVLGYCLLLRLGNRGSLV